MDIKKIFENCEDQGSFIKTTSASPMDGSQKAALNRKGNQLYNDGNVEAAKRVFITTGYSDGLSRVGDYYKSQNRPLDALRMYWTAPDKTKSEPIIEQVAYILQGLLDDKDAEDQVLKDE
uniref:Uncharacterized protein n=1 Tax=uncultured bacterium contig00077 TaxID=1181555 RepID=A0A806JZ54_9BACT|nr:hypothetical protein [uncultured bacterium contig00077]